MERRLPTALVLIASVAGYAGCMGVIGDGSGDDSSVKSSGGAPDVTLPDGTHSVTLLPTRIRRLTVGEYDASARALTGTTTQPSNGFAPDARVNGYTVNDGQVVDAVLAKQIAASAEKLAAEVKGKLTTFAPCADPKGQAESCAATFVKSFGEKAYRRPIDKEETDALLAVYKVGATGGTYADGIELVARAALQSAGFLYLTEMGDGSSDAAVALTSYELASSLSYLVTGGPPDEALLQAAIAGALAKPEGREAEVRRLLKSPAAEARVARVIREWLGIDRIVDTAKDSNVYPEFAAVRPAMEAETAQFIHEVMTNGEGTVGELLGADWTVADPKLAAFYGTSAAASGGRVKLADRRGILNQGAFLSVYAHATETAPVLRGVAVLRRVTCFDMASPSSLNIKIVPPVPDPTKTTRERFVAHSTDPVCRACHSKIDPFGFSFERFDGSGKLRTMDNGKPVDSAVDVAMGKDVDGAYADSAALAEALSTSEAVRSCFARQLFRAGAGAQPADSAESEEAFLEAWSAVPAAAQGNIVETLITYVKSSLFSHRRVQ